MFDFELEIQCVYTEYSKVEPRLLSLIQNKLRSDARVEAGIAIVASYDPGVAQMASRRRGEFGVVDVHLPTLTSDRRDLRQRLATVVTSVDHYDLTYPVREPSGFFGRRRELDELTQSLDRGQSVGIFGLRKAGKTSLLNYVRRIREESSRLVVNLDISEISAADDLRRKLVQRAFHAFERWSKAEVGAGREAPIRQLKLRLVTREGNPRGDIENLRMYWTEDLARIARARGQRLELFVDEIDQAFPERSNFGEEEARQMVIALTQLRGLIQQEDDAPGVVLLCAGVDPALFERARIGRRDNLLYKLVRLVYLAPMTNEDMADMVRSLGRRMGLRYSDHRVIQRLFDEYGGHPLLTRKACSIAVRDRDPEQIPWHVPLTAIENAIKSTGDGSPSEQALDVFDSFAEWFPDEAAVLSMLWSKDATEQQYAREIIEDDPESVAHAAPYGLADEHLRPRIKAIRATLGR